MYKAVLKEAQVAIESEDVEILRKKKEEERLEEERRQAEEIQRKKEEEERVEAERRQAEEVKRKEQEQLKVKQQQAEELRRKREEEERLEGERRRAEELERKEQEENMEVEQKRAEESRKEDDIAEEALKVERRRVEELRRKKAYEQRLKIATKEAEVRRKAAMEAGERRVRSEDVQQRVGEAMSTMMEAALMHAVDAMEVTDGQPTTTSERTCKRCTIYGLACQWGNADSPCVACHKARTFCQPGELFLQYFVRLTDNLWD